MRCFDKNVSDVNIWNLIKSLLHTLFLNSAKHVLTWKTACREIVTGCVPRRAESRNFYQVCFYCASCFLLDEIGENRAAFNSPPRLQHIKLIFYTVFCDGLAYGLPNAFFHYVHLISIPVSYVLQTLLNNYANLLLAPTPLCLVIVCTVGHPFTRTQSLSF